MVGARVFHYLFWDTQRFLADPTILFTGAGGMAVMGATVGTGFGGWVYCRLTGANFLHWCDGLMAPICICLSLGRMACFLNGDAYGMPTASSWGMVFSEDSLDWTAQWKALHHLYAEVVLMFGAFLFVLWLQRTGRAKQKLFFVFWALYGANRLVIETLRFDRNIAFGNLTYAQLISIVLILYGIGGVLYTRAKWRDSGPPAPVLK